MRILRFLVRTLMRILRFLVRTLVIFVRLFYQSVYLALGQIWANKTRSMLTTLGIIIGVASVTAVIAALSGLKAKILTQVESLGTNSIFISASRPDSGPLQHASWWSIRFQPEHFEGLLEHCPSVEKFGRWCDCPWSRAGLSSNRQQTGRNWQAAFRYR